jgi:hypothetical protein
VLRGCRACGPRARGAGAALTLFCLLSQLNNRFSSTQSRVGPYSRTPTVGLARGIFYIERGRQLLRIRSIKRRGILTPPSSKMGLSLVFGVPGRYSAFRLCAHRLTSADTPRAETEPSRVIFEHHPRRRKNSFFRARPAATQGVNRLTLEWIEGTPMPQNIVSEIVKAVSGPPGADLA